MRVRVPQKITKCKYQHINVKYEHLERRTLMNGSATKVCKDMVSTILSFGSRHLGIYNCHKSERSLNQARAELFNCSPNSPSQSILAVHISCNNNFALIAYPFDGRRFQENRWKRGTGLNI